MGFSDLIPLPKKQLVQGMPLDSCKLQGHAREASDSSHVEFGKIMYR